MPEKTGSNKPTDIGREFERSAASAKVPPDYSLGGTARAEIENVRNHETALDKHDQKWLRERDRLSNSAMPIPEFDLGSKEHRRNLLGEYEERRGEWYHQQAAINIHFGNLKSEIRENGTTLSSSFEKERGVEFKVNAPGVNRKKER